VAFGPNRSPNPVQCDFGATAVLWGPGTGPLDGTNGDELSRGEVAARLRVFEDFAEQQRRHPELAEARVVETPPLLGIRQTRFIEGEYKLTADDALRGTRFDDVVALSPCPIISCYGYRRYLEHQGYDIPYRCLVPRIVEQLLVAGRCISSAQEPYESHRAMVPIMAIGQAAGTAAALCCQLNVTPRQLDIRRLQATLVAQGAVLR
jgi:hypothetical protein